MQPVFQNKGKSKQTERTEIELKETEEVVFKRYYHLFKKGELEQLFSNIPQCKIIESTSDHENWYVIAENIQA